MHNVALIITAAKTDHMRQNVNFNGLITCGDMNTECVSTRHLDRFDISEWTRSDRVLLSVKPSSSIFIRVSSFHLKWIIRCRQPLER